VREWSRTAKEYQHRLPTLAKVHGGREQEDFQARV
jgi:hypothetical protein